MKKFCRYAVIEVETACLLVRGQKWKDFESSSIRYIKSGTFRRLAVHFNRVTEYFREIEIYGSRCVIIYWVDERAKNGKLYNIVQQRGWCFCLRGCCYSLDKIDYRKTNRRMLERLGISKKRLFSY